MTKDPIKVLLIEDSAGDARLKVIAEGVETEDQLRYLRSLRCDEMQGFYFSQPLSVDKLSELLHAGTRLQTASIAYA